MGWRGRKIVGLDSLKLSQRISGFTHLKKTFMKGKAIYETWVWFEKNQQLYDVFGFGTVDKEQ